MKTKTVFLAAAAIFCPMITFAQSTPTPPTHDHARTFLVLRLAEELNLPDDKALEVSAVIRKSDEHRNDLAAQREQLEKQIRTALDHNPPDDAALAKLVSQANDIDQQLAQIPETSYRDIQKLLTVEQQAKLVLFRPQLRRQIRGAMRRRLEGGGSGDGGGGGGHHRHEEE